MPSINILILSAASRSPVNHEDTYPTCLMEENGSSLLEKIIVKTSNIKDANYTYAFYFN